MTSPNIILCTLSTGDEYREITRESSVNKKQYCSRHGYTLIEDYTLHDPTRHPAWSKLHLLLKFLEPSPTPSFVVWMDADIYIMNIDTTLESFIDTYMSDPEVHLLTGCDWKMSNTGTMIFRNCDWSREFIQAILDNKDYPIVGNWEQDSFQDLVARNVLEASTHVRVTPRPEVLNSYWFNYVRGQFLLHFAGCRGGALAHVMKLYCPHRMQDDTDQSFVDRMVWLHSEYRHHADRLLEAERRRHD